MKQLILLLLIATITACTNAQTLTPDPFHHALTTDTTIQLLDVRTPDEYNQAHIPHATLININDPHFETQIHTLHITRPVYLYCHSGRRSRTAATILKKHGFHTVVELKGGIEAWQQAGKPTTTP
ncbi:MAG TPA: rhodanese-like domain-containing protein [Flavipsychrobacter sp.]|nr:rhodanese-like domain-containing protein [Flavipsychrobacter sp.]